MDKKTQKIKYIWTIEPKNIIPFEEYFWINLGLKNK